MGPFVNRGSCKRLQEDLKKIRVHNNNEHGRLEKEARLAVEKLSDDSQFLGHVREIIRFVKNS